MSLSMRPYDAPRDLERMRALLRAFGRPGEYPAPAELSEVLDPGVSDTPANTAVWEDDTPGDGLAGFAFVSPFNNLHLAFRPGALTPAVERELMDWAIDRRRRRGGPDGMPMTLDAAARSDDETHVALLRRHGFAPGPDTTIHMERALADPIPAAHVPSGYIIRPLAGAAEVPAYVAVHQAAYGTQKMTSASRLAIMRGDMYRPGADLVVVAPDGTLAAFCVCLVDDDTNQREDRQIGEIAIVGTHPAHQRRGLGRAVVLAGLHALRALGLETAVLTTAGDNTYAIRLYEALGFRADYTIQWYSLAVS